MRDRLKNLVSGRNGSMFADQVVSSASNALAVLAAGWLLDLRNMNTYALWQLAALSLMALQRALLSEPSLALTDESDRADATVRHVLWVLIPVTLVGAVLGGWQSHTPTDGVAVAMGVFVLLQDVLRYRAFGLNRPNAALVSDSVYLVVLAGALAAYRPHTAATMFVCWAAPAAVACLPLLVKNDHRGGVPVRGILSLGKYQVVDWGIVMLSGTLPLFLINRVVAVSSVGAFRFAQTLTGPLNTISSFLTLKFLVDGAVMRSEPEASLRHRVRRSIVMLVGVNAFYAVCAFTGWFVLRNTLKPQLTSQLFYALPLTLLSSVITAPAAVWTALAKAVRLQRFAIPPRIFTMIGALGGFVLGVALYRTSHVDPLAVLTIVVPVVTLLSWLWASHRIFGHLAATRDQPVGSIVDA